MRQFFLPISFSWKTWMGWILILFSVSVCFISSIETVQNENHPAVPPTLVYHNEPSSNHQPKIDETVSLSTSAPTEFDSSATSTLKLGEPIYQEALYILNELDRSYPHYHHLGHAYVDSILHFSTVLDDKNSFSKWTWTSYFTWNFIYEDFVKVVFDFISTIVSSPFSFSPSSSLEPLPPTRSTLAKYMSNVHQAIGFLEKAWHEFKHVNAGHLLATIYFYGNYSLPLRPSLAFPLFQQLSQHVYPNVIDAHYYLGWFYATNFGHVLNSTHLVDETLQTKDSPPSSTQDPVKDTTVFTTTQQPRAHLHFQLAASYGNHTLAEMTMGYRHTAGIGCAISCEKSLPYFYNVARKVMDVYYAGPPGGQSLPSSPNRLYLDEGGMYGPGSVFGKGGKSESAITEEDAFEYYKYLADNGDIESQYVLGMSFYLGTESVPKHYLRSLRYFGLAANTVFEGHEPKHHAILAAKASGWVGRMYLRGEGVVANNATAQRWFTKGAKHHDLQSLTYLGILAIDKFMARGPNIMPNEEVEVAVKYLQTAAKQDFPEAQSYLGRFYYGLGKYVEASRYLSLASRHGNLPAMYVLAELYERGLGVNSNCNVANTFYRSVAEKGFEWLYPHLDTAYQSLQENPYHRDFAVLLFLLAAERGNEVAQCNVAWMLDQEPSEFVPEGMAVVQWNRAGNQDNGNARLKVGDAYYEGHTVQQHYPTAVTYYTAAAELDHNAMAMWNLGYMYQHGLGVSKDYHLAKRYYDQCLQVYPDAWLPVTLSLAYLHLTNPKEYVYLQLTPSSGISSGKVSEANNHGDPNPLTDASNTDLHELKVVQMENDDWHYRDIQKSTKKKHLKHRQGDSGSGPSSSPTGTGRHKTQSTVSSYISSWLSWLHSSKDEDDLETFLILGLCILVGYLVYLRQLHFHGQQRPLNNNRPPPPLAPMNGRP